MNNEDALSPDSPPAPSAAAWLNKGLLGLAVLLLASGLISFFAFNWQGMRPALKFSLLFAVVVLGALAGMKTQGMSRKACLFLAFVGCGVLLATIGQVYQTGADAWQLFAAWAALGLLWAIASRASLIWLLVLLLIQLAALRYMNMRFGLLEFIFMGLNNGRGLMPVGVAALCLHAWELAWRFWPGSGMQGRLGTRALSMLVLVMVTWSALEAVLERGEGSAAVLGLLALGFLAFYAWRLRRDIPLLGFVLLAMDLLLVVTLGRTLGFHDFFSTGLLLGLVFVGLAALIVSMLRKMLPAGPLIGEHPWFLSVIMGFSAWVGSILILGFLATLTLAIGTRGVFWLAMGAALLVLSIVLISRSTNMVRQQFGLAFSLAGQAAFAWGLSQTLGVHDIDQAGAFLSCLLVLYAVLVFAVPYSGHRFFAVLGFWAALCMLAFALLWSGHGAFFRDHAFFKPLLLSTLAALAGVVVLSRAHFGKALGPAPLYGTLAAIAIAVFVFGLFVPRIESEFGMMRRSGLPFLAGTLTPFELWSFTTSAALALVSWIVLWPFFTGAMRWACGGFLLLAVLGLSQSPVLFCGLLFLAVAAPGMLQAPHQTPHQAPHQAHDGRGPKVLALAGVLMGLTGFSFYYYSLSWPLWLKSLVLAGLGLLVLWARPHVLPGRALTQPERGPLSFRTASSPAGADRPPSRPALAASPAIFVALFFSLVAGAFGIFSKEQIIRHGEHVFLELRPVDPRSLMQGDYMALGFVVADAIQSAQGAAAAQPGPSSRDRAFFVRDGLATLALDERRVARLAGQADPVRPGLVKLRYQNGPAGVGISTNAWFFQEGEAARFQQARYGEFVVDKEGQALLIGLRDRDLKPL